MKKSTKPLRRWRRALAIATAMSAAVFATPAVQAQNPSPPALAPGNPSVTSLGVTDFIESAGQWNRKEIALAKMAKEKAENPAVRELAERIIDEHEENFDTLERIARERELPLFRSLTLQNQRDIDRLEKVHGGNFDRAYTRFMLEEEVGLITKYDHARRDFDQPYLRHYIETTLPVLRKDLRHTEIAARTVGVNPATISEIIKGLPSAESERGVTLNGGDGR